MRNTPKRLTPEGVTCWRRKDTWTIYETAFLLCGYEPPADIPAEKQTPKEVREAAENMGRARIAGHLRTIGTEDDNGRKYMLRQRDVIAWAACTYPEFLCTAIPATQNPHTDPPPEITLPAGTRVVAALAVPTLIAQALHPDEPADGLAFQAALRSHVRMLNKAARDGTVKVVSFYGEALDLRDADASGTAGAFLTGAELTRYLSTLPLPIALRIAAPGEPPPVRAVPVARQNDETVLTAIRAAGYDPKKLPPRVNGKPWVKSVARGKCALTVKQFNAAWERLLKAGEIVIKS